MRPTPPAAQAQEKPLYPNYWFVSTPWDGYIVSSVMAGVVERAVTRWPRPAWLSLVDVGGARVLVRTETIVALQQSSPESRALFKRFRRERKQEDPEAHLGL